MNRVVLTSTQSDIYNFFLPIACRLWRTQIDYEPIVFLVGTWKEWGAGHCAVVLRELDKSGYYTQAIDHVPGVDDGNVSMSIRQHAAALDWHHEDDSILIGDIDLLPLKREFYNRYFDVESKGKIVIHHSDMYADRYWPAYGPKMTVAMWREVMDLSIGDIRRSLLKTFQDGNVQGLIAAKKADYRDSRIWTFDEEFASAKIRASRFHDSILRVNCPPEARLCRNSWPHDAQAKDYVDAHCPRPGWTDDSWTKIRALLAQVIPWDLVWLDKYVEAYRAARMVVV